MSGTRIAAAIAFAWMLFGLAEVKHHGLAIDSPSLFYAGDRTLFWLEHPGHPEALDFNYPAPEPAGFHSAFFPFPDKFDPMHYPVLAGVVAALASQLADPLGFDPVAGHHLGLVLLHAIGLFWFTLLAIRLFGKRVGTLTGLALLCFPAAVGQAFNNAKDWPCADYYGCAMLAGLEALVWRRPGGARTAGVFAGLALSCKLNGVFALACLGLLAAYAFYLRTRQRGRLDFSAALDLVEIYAIAGALFFFLWPYLYHGPIQSWPKHVADYLDWYLAYGKSPRATFTDYPLRSLLFTTPPLALACALASPFGRWRDRPETRAAFAFALLWTFLPILRSMVPHSNFYDGNRHFLEYIPGLCLLAGFGADWLGGAILSRVPSRVPARTAALALGVLAAGWALFPIADYRPFEGTYFNFLVGGLGGAQSRALYDMPMPHDPRVRGTEGDYWYGNLGDGLPRLRALLQPDQGFALCGPAPQQVQMSWPEGAQRLRRRPAPSDLVYVSPREVFCGLGLVRALEETRPILYRAERGGGLVYEILGAVDGARHAVLTAPSLYERDRFNFGSL